MCSQVVLGIVDWLVCSVGIVGWLSSSWVLWAGQSVLLGIVGWLSSSRVVTASGPSAVYICPVTTNGSRSTCVKPGPCVVCSVDVSCPSVY